MKASDLPLIHSVGAPSVHPRGSVAVVSVTRPDLGADSYVGQLWIVPLGAHAGAARRLTRGFRDTAPQFSPDGQLLAFLRAVPGSAPQLHVMDAAGGEPVQLSDRKLGVSEFRWSPDGARLAFVSRVPEQGRYGTVDGLGAEAEPPRRITTMRYTQNGLGYDLDRHAHVFLVDAPDVFAEPVVQPVASAAGPATPLPAVPEAAQLTSADADHGQIAFSPDGARLALVAATHPDRDSDLLSSVLLFEVPTGASAEAEPDAVPPAPVDASSAHGDFSVSSLEWAPSGALYFTAQDVGPQGTDFVAKNTVLFVIDSDGAAPRRLSEPESQDIAGRPVPLGDDVLVIEQSRGTAQLLRIAPDGASTALSSGELDISGVGVSAVGGSGHGGGSATIAVAYGDPQSFGELAVIESSDRHEPALRRLTDFSAAIRERGLVQPAELIVTGRHDYPVHGWVAVPEGEGPHPVLLMIHGGPFASYGVRAFDETQVLVDAGYAVVYCNPRGSAGYGQAHGRAIRQRMGTVDLDDVLDFLDGALAADTRLDGARTGILGGSYGGYLTAWTIAHEHRFQAAIVERGFLDPHYFAGTSDIGSFFGQEYVGTDPALVAAQSPQAHVGKVRTPTLVLHSEQDLRCPLGQAERYYAALKRQGTEAELVIFPGENHELSRAGRPRHREQRFEILLEWFGRYLPVERSAG